MAKNISQTKKELENAIIGLLFSNDKYRFVDKAIVAEVVRDTFKLIKIKGEK